VSDHTTDERDGYACYGSETVVSLPESAAWAGRYHGDGRLVVRLTRWTTTPNVGEPWGEGDPLVSTPGCIWLNDGMDEGSEITEHEARMLAAVLTSHADALAKLA
jgi:hypothetical protein